MNLRKLWAKYLLKIRDFFWKIRYKISKDAFESGRSEDYCGTFSMKEHNTTLADFMSKLANKELAGRKPELNCLLQYEETGQIASFHWFVSKKHQVHMRLFADDRGDQDDCIVVHTHLEIRPDYNPLAHVLGIGFEPYCELAHLIIYGP